MQRRLPSDAVGRIALTFALMCFVPLAFVHSQDAGAEAKTSTQEALQAYSDAASFQNNGAYKLAVQEWEKFTKNFTNDPLAPKANHYLGVCRMQLNDYAGAATAFAATTKFPPFEMTEEAYLNLGWCQFKQAEAGKADMFAESIASFNEMMKKFPPGRGKLTDQALFYQGEANYAQDKKQEAIAAYGRLVKQFAQSTLRTDAIYALGVTQEELGEFAAAGLTYDLFLKDAPKSELVSEVKMRKAETILQAGLSAEQSGDGAAAKQSFSLAEKQFATAAAIPGFESADHATFRQALAVLKLGEHDRAANLYASIPAKFQQSTYIPDATLSAGRSYYRANKLEQATTWFNKALALGGANTAEASHWLCRVMIKSGKYAEAAKAAEAALPKAADSPFLVSLKMDVADAYYELPEKRAESLAKYLAIANEHADHSQAPQALYNAAFAALELKQYDEALKHVAAFRAKHKGHRLQPDIDYISAESNLLTNKYDVAETEYKALTAANANHSEIQNWVVRLGLAIYLQKKYQPTIDALTSQLGNLKTPASLAEAKYLIGASHYFLGQHEQAVANLTQSLQAAPQWRQADETTIVLSRAQRALNKTDEAIATATKVLTSFPDSAIHDRAHFRLGEYTYAQGDFAKASSEYDIVITKHPQSTYLPYAIYGKGWSQLKTNAHATAAETFTKLIDGYPEHELKAEAVFARGMCRRLSGDFANAVKDIDAFLATKPQKPQSSNALYEKGLAQVGVNDHAGAVQTFDALLKDDPEYPTADKVLYELGWANKTLKKTAESTAAFSQLASKYGNSPLAAEAFFHVGEGHYAAKKYKEAAAAYSEAKKRAKEGPLGEKVLYKLGWSLFQQQQYEPATQEFAGILTSYKGGALNADASFMKAESLFKQEKYEEALASFGQARVAVEATQNVSPVMHVLTLLHGGQAAGQLKKWDVSLTFLKDIPTKFPDSNYVSEAFFERGRAQQGLGDKEAAMTDFVEAAKNRRAVGAQAQFMVGEVLFGEKKYEEAVLAFQRLMFGYGGDAAAATVKKWQAKAGFEAARCYDVRIKEADEKTRPAMIEGATKMYKYVVDKHGMDPLAATAQKRLTDLTKLSQ